MQSLWHEIDDNHNNCNDVLKSVLYIIYSAHCHHGYVPGMAGPNQPGPAWPEGLAWTARARLGAKPTGEPGQGSEIFFGLGRAGTDFIISRAGRDSELRNSMGPPGPARDGPNFHVV